MTGERKPVFVIAEAGVNHDGSLARAKALVEAAAAAGADAVKFQTWVTERVITKDAPKPAYQRRAGGRRDTQYEMLKRLELPFSAFRAIKAHCDRHGILFLSTADEIESASFLAALQPMFKVGSAELTDLPFLAKLAAFRKPVILSTGMGTMAEIRIALDTLRRHGLPKSRVTVLHCTTAYPTPMADVHLRAMLAIRDALGVAVGYSDHTLGIAVPIAAAALGAAVIEKHFTLDNGLPGPDHRMSLEPAPLAAMVAAIRNVELALGRGAKGPSPSEAANIPFVRKSIVAAAGIAAGERFSERNLTVKRPGTGISPLRWKTVIGRRARRPFSKDELIEL
ncbi:MAG: N-acetylneuraminate synthase [Elusimicrobia bacterium]|nr:N-acetylneuraminate synthase [Elusimicrobiota bacterium]